MKILHFITSLRTGGAERMLQKVVTALRSKGYESAVVSLTEASRIGAELQENGTPVVALGGTAGLLFPHHVIASLRTLKKFQPDVIHSWMYHANVLGHALVMTRRRGSRPALIGSIRGCLDVQNEDKWTLRAVR